jgi:hypothetical protein
MPDVETTRSIGNVNYRFTAIAAVGGNPASVKITDVRGNRSVLYQFTIDGGPNVMNTTVVTPLINWLQGHQNCLASFPTAMPPRINLLGKELRKAGL